MKRNKQGLSVNSLVQEVKSYYQTFGKGIVYFHPYDSSLVYLTEDQIHEQIEALKEKRAVYLKQRAIQGAGDYREEMYFIISIYEEVLAKLQKYDPTKKFCLIYPTKQLPGHAYFYVGFCIRVMPFNDLVYKFNWLIKQTWEEPKDIKLFEIQEAKVETARRKREILIVTNNYAAMVGGFEELWNNPEHLERLALKLAHDGLIGIEAYNTMRKNRTFLESTQMYLEIDRDLISRW